MSEHHTILGGKVHIYKRPNSSSWQCASYPAEKNRRTTTQEDSLSKAEDFAEDWYLQLLSKLRDGELKSGKVFREAAKLYLREFEIMTQGRRSPTCARGQHARANGHLPEALTWNGRHEMVSCGVTCWQRASQILPGALVLGARLDLTWVQLLGQSANGFKEGS